MTMADQAMAKIIIDDLNRQLAEKDKEINDLRSELGYGKTEIKVNLPKLLVEKDKQIVQISNAKEALQSRIKELEGMKGTFKHGELHCDICDACLEVNGDILKSWRATCADRCWVVGSKYDLKKENAALRKERDEWKSETERWKIDARRASEEWGKGWANKAAELENTIDDLKDQLKHEQGKRAVGINQVLIDENKNLKAKIAKATDILIRDELSDRRVNAVKALKGWD